MGPSNDMRFWKGKILIWVHQKTWGFWVHQKSCGGEKLAKFGRVHQKTWVPKSEVMLVHTSCYLYVIPFFDYFCCEWLKFVDDYIQKGSYEWFVSPLFSSHSEFVIFFVCYCSSFESFGPLTYHSVQENCHSEWLKGKIERRIEMLREYIYF